MHTPPNRSFRSKRTLIIFLTVLTTALIAAGCGSNTAQTTPDSTKTTEGTNGETASTFSGTLRVGAIPDQDPEKLQRTYGLVADYLKAALPDIDVEYIPVTDYQGAIASFRTGDLDLVWFGGLTGVQARAEVEGSIALAQRDIDAKFTSVFIASPDAGIEPFDDVAGLSAIKGHSLTFGSESSTSGRLMPQSFLTEAGVNVKEDLTGEVGFSGAHDKTIEVVASGSYDVGALNSSVWDQAVADGTVDETKVIEIFRTPEYFDYHWVAQPGLDDTFGEGFTDALTTAFTDLDGSDDTEKEILELFGAEKFITTSAENYESIEKVAKEEGLIVE